MTSSDRFIWLCNDGNLIEAEGLINEEDFDINYVVEYPRFQFSHMLLGRREVMNMILKNERLDFNKIIYNQPIQISCLLGDKERVEELVKHPELMDHERLRRFPPLYLASSMGYVEIVEILLKQDWIDVNQIMYYQCPQSGIMMSYGTAFYVSCLNKRFETIKVLLNCDKVNINISEDNRHGETAFHTLCEYNISESIDFLLENSNIDINLPSTLDNYTPLMFSVLGERPKAFNVLVKWAKIKNLDFNAKNNRGETAFSISCLYNKTAVNYMLKECKDIDYNVALGTGLSGIESAYERSTTRFPPSSPIHKSQTEILEILVNDKRIKYPKITLDESNEHIWEMLILGMAMEPSRIDDVSHSEYFMGKITSLEFLYKDKTNKFEKLRIHFGIAHEMAASLWINMRLIEKGIVKLVIEKGNIKKFFNITLLLPLELQMLISNRVYGINDAIIEKKQIQKQLEYFDEFLK